MKKKSIVLCVVLFCLVCAGIIVGVFFLKKNTPPSNDKEEKKVIEENVTDKENVIENSGKTDFTNFGARMEIPDTWTYEDTCGRVIFEDSEMDVWGTDYVIMELSVANYDDGIKKVKLPSYREQPTEERVNSIKESLDLSGIRVAAVENIKLGDVWYVKVKYENNGSYRATYITSNGYSEFEFSFSNVEGNEISEGFLKEKEKIISSLEIYRKSVKGKILNQEGKDIAHELMSGNEYTLFEYIKKDKLPTEADNEGYHILGNDGVDCSLAPGTYQIVLKMKEENNLEKVHRTFQTTLTIPNNEEVLIEQDLVIEY